MPANNFTQRLKPGVPRSVHLFAAPFLWTAVGGMLMIRGWPWLGAGNERWLIFASILLGTCKSLLVLDKVARKSIQRIVLFKDGTCLGAIYSWKSWMLVLLMMASGFVLRRQGAPGPLLGVLYCAIGWSLGFSGRLGWIQWYVTRKSEERSLHEIS